MSDELKDALAAKDTAELRLAATISTMRLVEGALETAKARLARVDAAVKAYAAKLDSGASDVGAEYQALLESVRPVGSPEA